jgi:hypothetical protein
LSHQPISRIAAATNVAGKIISHVRNLRDALRLTKAVMNATESELRFVVSAMEDWAELCVLAIVNGLVLEIIVAAGPFTVGQEHAAAVVANTLIALGVYFELLFSKRGNSAQAELVRRSDLVAAAANERAAAANERAAQIERLTARRHVSPEQRTRLETAVREKAAEIDLLIEFQRDDSDAYIYAHEWGQAFRAAGVTKARIGANSFLFGAAFGLRVTDAVGLDHKLLAHALVDPISPMVGFVNTDLTKHLPSDQTAPNLYIFVGPKPPPEWSYVRPPEAVGRDANTVAEEGRKSRVGIEVQLLRQPASQINNREFIAKMSEFKGVVADIIGHGSSHHVIGVARLLESILKHCGWETTWWRDPNGSSHLSIRVVTCRGADERTLKAANALMNALATPELHCLHILNAGGSMIDFAKPVVMPNGETRDASKNAPMRILVGTRPNETWVRPVDDLG